VSILAKNSMKNHEASFATESLTPRSDSHAKRFPFGENWRSFLEVVDESRIRTAEDSLTRLLGVEDLNGRSFLDVGCGSGLFSLAARRLGATVVSFDADTQAVACTMELRKRFAAGDNCWTIRSGSVLDDEYMTSLGQFDIVYAWGVLHHTGAMWRAINNTLVSVERGGQLVIALYNDQGWKSRLWRLIKKTYCSGTVCRLAITSVFVPAFAVTEVGVDLIALRNPVHRYIGYRDQRGMSKIHDWRDWLGGFPFEVAKPGTVIEFCHAKGFVLEKLLACGNRLGNNQFVFRRDVCASVK
jgi:2-polyprenyl-3-methyl-5-hydroxy-6-metoxy-1,4-benzoquinol methylase